MSKHSNGRRLKEKPNNKIKILFVVILILILVGILIFSGIKIFNWFLNNKENNEIKENILSYVEEIENDENDKKTEYSIDFDSLKEINSDIVGFLKVNNTNIEYAVVKTNNNGFYLNHNFEKKQNLGGWIFADYNNKFDDTDYNIIIYGHNIKDGSMFGTLKNTFKEEWYKNEDNKYITFITENGTRKYEVFSIYEEKASDYPIQTKFSNDSEYLEFIKNLKEKSIYEFNADVSATTEIITLSTCGNSNTNRVLLHAKLVTE